MQELIKRILATRNAAQLEHWNTMSDPMHEHIGTFYSDVVEAIDVLVESYQGVNGKIGYPIIENVQGDIVDILNQDLLYMAENRMGITDGIPFLLSLVDNLCVVYSQTLDRISRA